MQGLSIFFLNERESLILATNLNDHNNNITEFIRQCLAHSFYFFFPRFFVDNIFPLVFLGSAKYSTCYRLEKSKYNTSCVNAKPCTLVKVYRPLNHPQTQIICKLKTLKESYMIFKCLSMSDFRNWSIFFNLQISNKSQKYVVFTALEPIITYSITWYIYQREMHFFLLKIECTKH